MQQELQLTLLIIGGLFIIGVLVHGFWSIRKNNKRLSQSNYETRKNWEPTFSEDEEEIEYDDVVISSARVIDDPAKNTPSVATPDNDHSPISIELPKSKTSEAANSEVTNSEVTNTDNDSFTEENIAPVRVGATDNDDAFGEMPLHKAGESADENSIPEHASVNQENKTDNIAENIDETLSSKTGALDKETESTTTYTNQDAPIYSGVVTQPKPEFTKSKVDISIQDESIPEPPGFLLRKGVDGQNENTRDAESTAATSQSESNGVETKPEPPRPDFSLDAESFEQPTVASVQAKAAEVAYKEKPKKELSLTEQAKRFVRRNKKTVADKIRKDPVVDTTKATDDQMRIDFDERPASSRGFSTERSGSANEEPSIEKRPEQKGASEKAAPTSDVLILNVQTPSDSPISGAALLPMLLTLGFKFGEHDIFHRHVNTNGKGPILFSLTNMFKPGVFDIDNMENFSTQGVALFMMLPIDGDAQQVFNMMHNAARKISEEFGGKILDGNKVPISKQSLQQYAERIREFERRKLSQ